jgi:hypothetical protein
MTAPTAVVGVLALDAAYRAAIAQTALVVARTLMVRWTSVDATDLAGSSGDWLTAGVAAVLAGQRNAQTTATAYANRVRQYAVPNAPAFTPPAPRPPNEVQVRKSLLYTGLARPAQLMARAEAVARGDVIDSVSREEREAAERSLAHVRQQIMEQAIKSAVGSSTRLVTTAGADQLEDYVRQDKVALGWVRTTKADPCHYCAMLASRGPVYKENSFKASNVKFQGVGEQKIHDICGCGLRPWFGVGEELPERTAEFEQLWIDATTGARNNAEAVRWFRQKYEGRGRT